MTTQFTQEEVNKMFVTVKSGWDELVAKSGLSEEMFIILDPTGHAGTYLMLNQQAKENVESQGLVYPELVKGSVVTVTHS